MAFLALVTTSARFEGSWVGPLKEMVTIWHPRFATSLCICVAVISYVLRICGNWVRRRPTKPVSLMTSRISVKGARGKEFHRFDPNPHFTLRLIGILPAARARPAAIIAILSRRVMVPSCSYSYSGNFPRVILHRTIPDLRETECSRLLHDFSIDRRENPRMIY